MLTMVFLNNVAEETRVAFEKTVQLPPNYEILNESDPCEHALFLLSGEIEVYKLSGNGKVFRLYTILPGESCVLNLSCILSRSSYSAFARTLSPCEVVLIPKKDFLVMFESELGLKDYVFQLISTRLIEITSRVEGIVLKGLDERLRDCLLESGDRNVVITHEQLANRLGTAREVISRLLKTWEHSGKIKLHRGEIELLTL